MSAAEEASLLAADQAEYDAWLAEREQETRADIENATYWSLTAMGQLVHARWQANRLRLAGESTEQEQAG